MSYMYSHANTGRMEKIWASSLLAQHAWRDRLAHTGKIEVYVWRPQDRAVIHERLTRKEA